MRSLPLLRALGLLALATGCSSPWRREPIAGQEGVYIYREHRFEDGKRAGLGNLHPAPVPVADIAFLLASLQHEDKRWYRKERIGPVFQGAEADALARHLHVGLGAVAPDERVRFLVVRKSLHSVFTGVTGVSGVAFCAGSGTLHIAFDAIGEGINAGEGGRPEDVLFPDDPTELESRYGLVPKLAATRLHRDPESGNLRRRWLEIDLALLAREERPPPVPAPAAAANAPLGPGPQATSAPSADAEAQEFGAKRDKLLELKRLRDAGALSAEEYQKEYERVMRGKE